MRVFKAPSLEVVQRRYPGFGGPVFVHELQAHIIRTVASPRLERHVPPGGVALDVGCGSGTMVKEMAKRAATAIGVDVDPAGFSKYPDLTVVDTDDTADLHRRPGGHLVVANAYDLPLASGTVDVVTSRWMFEHLEEPGAAVAEIARVLRPGGVALIVVPNRLHPGILLSSVLPLRVKQWALESTSGIQEEMVLPTYYRVNTAGSLRGWFERSGFETVEIIHVADPSYWIFSRSLFEIAAGVGRVAARLPLERFRMHMVGVFRHGGERP